MEVPVSKQAKRKGKTDAELSGLPIRRIAHYLSEKELGGELGPNGWKILSDTILKRYHFVPAKVEVEGHHIGVHASKTNGHMVKAEHSGALLHGSLVSAIINGKYVNAVSLYRLE